MPHPDHPSRRSPSLETAERRRNALLVAPFTHQISRWQARAAHLSALMSSGRMDAPQYLATALELNELLGEVGSVREAFTTMTLDKVQWTRVRDVARSLDQLAGHLEDLRERLATAHQEDGEPGVGRGLPH